MAINNASKVVGDSSGSGYTYRAFLYDSINDQMTDLGTLDGATKSMAFDISETGLIVGKSIFPDGSDRGCLWVNNQIKDLNDLLYSDSNWTVIHPPAISNNGQIVGQAELNGQEYAILLTPVGHLDYDNEVDFKDFAIFSSLWGSSNCNDSNNWCRNADINHNGQVDVPDLAKLSQHWLETIP